MGGVHYLTAGIYTVADAARLTGASPAQVRGWLDGHPNGAMPLLRNEFERMGHRVTLGFKNLIECYFVHAFAQEGLSIQSIRFMADEAKRILQDDHPFTLQVVFKTDGRRIFAEILNKASRRKELYDLKTRNWSMERIMRPFLRAPVEFKAGHASTWYPPKTQAPNVVVDPLAAFGQPTIKGYGVPTSALVDALRAESGDYSAVASWYEVPQTAVREAERFEDQLARAA